VSRLSGRLTLDDLTLGDRLVLEALLVGHDRLAVSSSSTTS